MMNLTGSIKTALGIAALSFAMTGIAVAQGIDVVFKIDESGSMSDEIADVKANVVTIFNALPAGSHVGLVGYGTTADHGQTGQQPHVHTALVSDPVAFQAAVDTLASTGSVEQGYRAVFESATDTLSAGGSLGFTGAPYCNILITDETPDQGGRTRQEAIDAMVNEGGIFFGIMRGTHFANAQPLADATGGQLFRIGAFRNDPQPVIEAVLAACVAAAIPVNLDIKPTSCPNPFKMKKKGVIPVALLGSEEFDVSRIVPESLTLEHDCEALRWSIEDVATPYEGEFSEPPLEEECTTEGADGWPDLTVKFDAQCVAEAQGEVTEREVRLWTVNGVYLDDEGNEIEFESQDAVRLMP